MKSRKPAVKSDYDDFCEAMALREVILNAQDKADAKAEKAAAREAKRRKA